MNVIYHEILATLSHIILQRISGIIRQQILDELAGELGIINNTYDNIDDIINEYKSKSNVTSQSQDNKSQLNNISTLIIGSSILVSGIIIGYYMKQNDIITSIKHKLFN